MDLYESSMSSLRPRVTVAAAAACGPHWRWRNRPPGRPVLNLWLITDGDGSWVDEHRRYDLSAGDCFVQRLWRRCDGDARGAGPSVIWANFELHDADGPLDLPRLDPLALPPIHRRVDNLALLTQLGRRMVAAFARGETAADDWLACILHELAAVDRGRAQAIEDPVVARCRDAIDAEPERNWSVAGMATRCGVGAGQFTRRFKLLTGQAPRTYVQHRRLERAKALLLMTDQAVAEIATATGYGDIFHFSRRFRQHVGVSPTAFRGGG